MINKKSYLIFEVDRPCPLCNHSDREILSKRMQFDLDCTTVICKNCGFCFVSPSPVKDVYNQFYREAYSIFYHKIHKELKPQDFLENKMDKDRFRKIEKFKKIYGSAVLEIGPGNGRFLTQAARKGAVCSAVEPSDEFRIRLAKNGITTVGDFLENAESSRRFDVICLFQVLEHFYDPRAAIDKIMSLLADDGIVVLDVPNIWKPFRNLDRYFLRYVHLSYFSPNSLTRLFHASGLEILRMDTGNANIYTPQSIFVIARKAAVDKASAEEKTDDDWRHLVGHLRRYRLKYLLCDAPLVHVLLVKRHLRKVIADSIIGTGYRSAKSMLKKQVTR